MTFKMAAAKKKTKVKGLPWTARLANPPWTAATSMEGRLALNCMALCHRKCYGRKACIEARLALKCMALSARFALYCKACPELQGLHWNAWHCATENVMDSSVVSTLLQPGSAKKDNQRYKAAEYDMLGLLVFPTKDL
jgi:hypothetical protein